jgi:uncharacterized membrane protein YhhN
MLNIINELIAIVAGIFYVILVVVAEHDFSVEFLVFFKSLPAFALSHGVEDSVLKTGLFMCAMGDAFLELEDKYADGSNKFFILGLLSFLSGHLFFVRYFYSFQKSNKSEPGVLFILAVLLVGVLYPCVTAVLTQQQDTVLAVGITIYGLCIGAMGYASFISHRDTGVWEGLTGSVFFVISDSLLAIDRFCVPLGSARLLVMSTYYPAIWLIAKCSLPKEKTPAKKRR